jgi:isopropylmalate/homocitrate/citramalate synthase
MRGIREPPDKIAFCTYKRRILQSIFWSAFFKEKNTTRRIDEMKEKKLIKKTFRFSERETALLERRAREAQMSQTDYIRVLVANRPRDNREFTEAIKELANQVKHIGININQITIHNNIGALSEEEINRLQKYMAQIRKEFMEVVAIGDMPHV